MESISKSGLLNHTVYPCSPTDRAKERQHGAKDEGKKAKQREKEKKAKETWTDRRPPHSRPGTSGAAEPIPSRPITDCTAGSRLKNAHCPVKESGQPGSLITAHHVYNGRGALGQCLIWLLYAVPCRLTEDPVLVKHPTISTGFYKLLLYALERP
ncbi:hypothetical protein DNTS_026415 [Danionella cerebrum]|uniref:Uncharacterized protein n=1 Tax=Danionella cerebrum TaxID=2873325 RepID=A0A553Q8I6_9TELE|nr:hypothetical protein DNTS_026415 [Danionella translucida]